MKYYAHFREGEPEDRWQPLKEHLELTAQKAKENAAKFGAGEFGYLVGMLHDVGKYSLKFQARLHGGSRVDHATAGAKEVEALYGKGLGKLLAYTVVGHHGGLPDGGSEADEDSLMFRLKKKGLSDYSDWRSEINLPLPRAIPLPVKSVGKDASGFGVAFFTRMLYSCLVDADFLDTERFIKKDSVVRGGWPRLAELANCLDLFMNQKQRLAQRTILNQMRKDIFEQCRQKATAPPGVFTLTVPTGGGKTLSSLSFALRHALNYGLERVVYVIPYTSIIEQNAEVFRSAVGADAVLEHHCNFQYERDDENNTIAEKLKLASENWDAPLVVTTNVQFFESLFANRSSKCRKLHNLARSVIILDEAQMIPTDFLKPCLLALVELVQNYGATVVLCTATQPALQSLLPADVEPVELVPNPEELYEVFRRVEVKDIGEMSDLNLSKELGQHQQVLCIVNTRRHARMIFDLLKGEGPPTI